MSYNKDVYRNQHTTERVSEDGELLSTSTKTQAINVLVKDNQHFASVYLELLRVAFDLDGTEMKVLFYCALYADLDANTITLTKTRKVHMQQLSAKYNTKDVKAKNRKMIRPGMGMGTINNALTRLVKRQFLFRVGTPGSGSYKVNSELFWRGTQATRNKDMNLQIKFQTENPEGFIWPPSTFEV